MYEMEMEEKKNKTFKKKKKENESPCKIRKNKIWFIYNGHI